MKPVVLSIAGLDPSGGAGTAADIKTIEAFGCYAAAAVTSLTFQNTVEVRGAEHVSSAAVRSQILPVFDDLHVTAVKTGMLPTRETIDVVCDLLREFEPKFVVVDPVVRSTSGFDLIDDNALRSMVDSLFPLATIVTPNMAEAERISGIAIESEADIAAASEIMLGAGAGNVLIKGGHRLSETENIARDHLFGPDGHEVFESEFIPSTATHGTGCTLSSAIAANLAMGKDLRTSIAAAKQFVSDAIRTAPMLGHGHSPLNISAYLATGKKDGD